MSNVSEFMISSGLLVFFFFQKKKDIESHCNKESDLILSDSRHSDVAYVHHSLQFFAPIRDPNDTESPKIAGANRFVEAEGKNCLPLCNYV